MNIAISIFIVAQAVTGDSLQLSVTDAIARAREHNATLLAARADARQAAAQPLDATRAFLPSLRVEMQGVRTTDPVAVFGLKLRQGVFAGTDLQLDALNDPSAYTGFTTSATIEVPLLAPEGLLGYAALRRAARAGAAGARRVAGATTFLVTRQYWDAQLAQRQVDALDTALTAARAHVDQATALRDQGLVTGLDARLADLRAAELEVRRVAAAAEAANALSRLGALLGLPDDVTIVLTDRLERTPGGVCDTTSTCDLADRADVAARRLGAEAASLDAKRAWAAQLPQVAAFGNLARRGRSNPWGGANGSGDWTIGIGVRWNVFSALSGIGGVRRTAAARDAARARYEDAQRTARVEARAARRMVTAAQQGVAIASRAHDEARVALDQARLRYRTGTSAITELLDVQAAATTARLNLVTTRHDLLVALAALEFAYGVHDQ